MEAVKEFCQSTKLTDWKFYGTSVVENLNKAIISGTELKDEYVKAVVRKIGENLRNRSLEAKLKEIFSNLLDRYPKVASQTMFDVLKKESVRFRSISGWKSQAKLALVPLRWTFVLLSRVEVTLEYLDLLSVFLSAFPATPSTRRLFTGVRKELMRRLLNPGVASRWLSLLLSASSFKFHYLVLLATVLAYYMQNEASADFPVALYPDVLRLFASFVLGSRERPDRVIIQGCGDLFKKVTHATFKDILLPALRKALLRNPDELMFTVSFMLSNLPIDLSAYCSDIGKLIIPLFSSSVMTTSKAAHDCMSALCRQCSDKREAQGLCKQLDGALKSSPTNKLTVAEHRCSVLKAMRCLVLAPLSSMGKSEVASEAAKILKTHIKQEVHVGTSVMAVSVLCAFCEILHGDYQPTVDFIEESLTSKTTPPPVRVAFMICVLALCREEGNSSLLPLPEISLSRLASLASMQAAGLEEAVVATSVLIRLHSPDPAPAGVWSFGNVHVEQLFSRKVLSTTSQETLPVMVGVAQALLCAEECKLSDSSRREWLGGVVKILLDSPWQPRRAAARCIQKFVESKPVLAEHLLDTLTDTVYQTADFPANWVLLALKSLTTPTHPKKQLLAVRSFLIAHHPAIVAVDTSAWLSLLRKAELDPGALMFDCHGDLASVLTANMAAHHESCVHGLRTVVICGGGGVVGELVEGVCSVLGASEVVRASEDDMEVLCTPEGQLWHAGLRKELEAAVMGGAEPVANMKKESKTYSYEDQKWEAELRQELLRKKRAESQGTTRDVKELLKKATKLSQKMKDIIETQLLAEEEKRKQLLVLKDRLLEGVELVEVVVREGNGGRDMLLPHIPRLCRVTMEAVRSPLARGYCRRVWGVMATAVFRDWTLAELFAETTFGTLTSKALSPVLPRVFSLLKDHTVATYDLNSGSHTLTLPLLSYVLTSRDNKAVSHDYKATGMQVLTKTVERHLKALIGNESEENFNSKLFPGVQTLRLFSSIIALDDESPKVAILKRASVSMFVSLLPHVLQDGLSLVRDALFHPCTLLRHTVLSALSALPASVLPSDPQLLLGLYIAQHEEDESNRDLAAKLWSTHKCDKNLPPNFSTLLTEHCCSSSLTIHTPAAKSLGVWLEGHPDEVDKILNDLITAYHTHRTTPPPTTDSFGREILVKFNDEWECRVGVAKALEQLSVHASSAEAMTFLKFVIPGTLSDPSRDVHAAIMLAAQAAISCHGDRVATELMSHAETSLNKRENTVEADTVRQSIILLMGTLAKHMDKNSPKVKEVVHLLLNNLDTPSQQVQEAIAKCLPPLAAVIKDDAEVIIPKLLEKLLESSSYSQRKGSAYGLAGLVKGLGIPILKQLEVIAKLLESLKDKKNPRHREGALFAIQSLSNILGKLFEPYIIKLLPDLLVCFGDGNQYVREAMDQTARSIMGQLSAHGVKLVLPSLLKILETEDSWRTKAGSVELLGAMAFCAPKQLSTCLPSIVPKLMDTLADSHSKVQSAGTQALRHIGSVIKNPEIQSLVPVLLEALSDPSNKANVCLQALLDTEFVHVIDPPSLALIMPSLKRTLDLRSTDTKKMAAQIIGNMYSLTDKKDLAPYLADVLPGLKQSLVDPVPEVRTVCAKALGAIVRGMGEEGMKDLLPWLLETLKCDGTSVDRSGAAQGISEVLYARGVEELGKVIPHFITASQDTTTPAHERDGYLMLFVYLPLTFGDQLSGFIGDILTPILKGLADESEFIRETSLLAGQTIVNRYADKAVEVCLPQLERGLFDDSWRIRCSSVQLLGDLLYKISGLSGKMSTESEEDDNFGTEVAHNVLLKSLGRECRDRVFAGLYMGRLDVAVIVRQTSLHVWKVVVTNTARTLREILPTLVHLLLGCLASQSPDKRKVAARTLGDLVRKLGERVLPEVIPMLEKGMGSESTQERQGVCIGLSEIIQQTSREQVMFYMASLLPTVQNSLCDPDSDVRAAAALTFDSLHSVVGPKVLDEVLTPLLTGVSEGNEGSDVALDALRQLMAVKSHVVLPHVVPQLIKPPVNIRALAMLTAVAGEALNRHLNRIIPAVIQSLGNAPTADEGAWQSAEDVVLNVQKEPGPAFLIEELVKCSHATKPEVRAVSMHLLYTLCGRSSVDLSEHLPQLIIFTTETLNDPSDEVCEKAWLGLDAVIKRIDQKELPHHTGYFKKALRTVSAALIGDYLRGFTLKGIAPALTLLKEGLIGGSPDEKEESARVLVKLIHLTAPQTLSVGKVVMMIAGPLIRVLGDRYSWNVKVATLEALVELVRKVGVAAKAFIPQLQTSYLKSLNDPNKPVRVQAVTGLTELLPLSPRVDPVFNDLHNGIKKNEEVGLRLTMLQALHGVIKVSGKKMGEKHQIEILSTLVSLQNTAQEGHRVEAAHCVGSLCAYLSDTQLHNTLATHILDLDAITDWAVLQARATSLSSALLVASARIVTLGLRNVVKDCVIALATSDRVPVRESGLHCVASYLNHLEGDGAEMIPTLSQGLTHSSLDIKIVACDVCAAITAPSDRLLSSILPLLQQNSREKNTAVRASVDAALVNLIQGDMHLKHVGGLLDASSSRKLEEVYLKSRARLSRK